MLAYTQETTDLVTFTEEILNPLMSSVTFIYTLKTSEKRRFSDVFRGYKNVTLDINGLMENFIFCPVTDILDIANPTAIGAVMAPTKSIRRNKSFLLTTLHHCYKLQHFNLLLSIFFQLDQSNLQ